MLSLIDNIDACDNSRISSSFQITPSSPNVACTLTESLLPLYLSTQDIPPIGFIRPIVLPLLTDEELFVVHHGWISISPNFDTLEKRTQGFKVLCEKWRDSSAEFSNVCGPKKWRNELYPVYQNPWGVRELQHPNYLFAVERSACALFGFPTFGVHMNMYIRTPEELWLWVPKRASTKQTWPGYLDNTVAGGMGFYANETNPNLDPTEIIIKEAREEASLDEALVRKHARPCGVVSYLYRTPEGWIQPEVEFLYDIEIPSALCGDLSSPTIPDEFHPRPEDGEVESFQLASLQTLRKLLAEGKFKANCAVVNIELLIRLGYVTPSEPHYVDLATRMSAFGGWPRA